MIIQMIISTQHRWINHVFVFLLPRNILIFAIGYKRQRQRRKKKKSSKIKLNHKSFSPIIIAHQITKKKKHNQKRRLGI